MNKKYKEKIDALSQEQFKVTQNNATEQPFNNKYWDNKKEGIYVDIVSGDPLFSSLCKYNSGTGWPSFFKALENAEITSKQDNSLKEKRVEVRTKTTHLGHIFDDGPKDFGGKRYCINSSSLEFIPKDQLIEKGYGDYYMLFSKKFSTRFEYVYLAGGCFWGVEHFFSGLKGVIDTKVGYCGGITSNPDYEMVSSGNSGHAETVEILFDHRIISCRQILKLFLRIHNPIKLNRQGNDIGTQYRSEIFYINETQKYIALKAIEQAGESGVFCDPIITKVSKLDKFYPAEDYHQKYLNNNPGGYNCHYLRKDNEF